VLTFASVTLLETKPFGKTGLRAAPLGLSGSYGIDARGVERAFHELGVNYFFFTGRDAGMREGLKSLIAAGHRDEIVIAGGANVPTGFGVRAAFEKDCKALGTDRLDVFQVFWVQYHWYVTGQTWPAMRKLREEGRVKMLGVSIHDRPLARRLVDELGLDMLMIRYNAAHRGAEKEIFADLPPVRMPERSEGSDRNTERKRPAIVAYTATRWGKLLQPAGDHGAMTPEECYRFPLSNPNVDVVLCGPRSYEELEQDARGVALGPLPAARLDEVRAFGDVVRKTAASRIAFGA
jgi:aryl-alcohol dehydrogenase-like predicted oxidoreductase